MLITLYSLFLMLKTVLQSITIPVLQTRLIKVQQFAHVHGTRKQLIWDSGLKSGSVSSSLSCITNLCCCRIIPNSLQRSFVFLHPKNNAYHWLFISVQLPPNSPLLGKNYLHTSMYSLAFFSLSSVSVIQLQFFLSRSSETSKNLSRCFFLSRCTPLLLALPECSPFSLLWSLLRPSSKLVLL